MLVCHDDNIRLYSDNMQCSSNKRVISQISLTCFYGLHIHISSFFFDLFFLDMEFDFFLELRTVKSSSCPFWRICFAAVCIENGLADLKTWMLQKSSWISNPPQFHGTVRNCQTKWSVDFWSCTTSNVSRRWGWNRSFELLEGWGFTLNTALTMKDQKRRW